MGVEYVKAEVAHLIVGHRLTWLEMFGHNRGARLWLLVLVHVTVESTRFAIVILHEAVCVGLAKLILAFLVAASCKFAWYIKM